MKIKTLLHLERMGLLLVPLAGCGDDSSSTTFAFTNGDEVDGGSDSSDTGMETGTASGEDTTETGQSTETDSTDSTDTTATDTTDSTDTGLCADGDTQPCYSGFPTQSEGMGLCHGGLQTCADGVFGPCIGETTPSLEACNNLDENCNGLVDDGNPGGGGACFSGQPGICSEGVQTCMAGDYTCVQTQQPVGEICFNALDDNCDGSVDEFCSCPYVYAFDGHAWRYETTIGGASLVGRPRHLQAGAGKDVQFQPLWARLDSASVLADRSVRVEVLAAEDEIVYFDHAELTAIHHPAGHEVVSSSAMQWSTLKRKDPRKFWAFPSGQCRTPERATWCGELDQREALSELTGTPAAYVHERENSYELDFGEVRDPKRAWLLIDGWKFKRTRGLAESLCGHRPVLEVRQLDGSWLAVKDLAAPRGDRKTLAIALTDLHWPTGRYELRVWTGTHEGGKAMWYLDRVRLVETTPAPISMTKIAVAHAELEFRGLPTLLAPEFEDRPRLSRNDGKGEVGAGQTYGAFTRYGDVTPLLRTPDDRVVVMRQGDVVALRFVDVPEPPPGFETSLFLHTNLVYKPRVVVGATGPSALTENVAPMPRRAMGRYGLDAPARSDSVYREYLACWNTREHQADRPANAAAA